MVDGSPPPARPEKPFAFRATLYTVGFLVFILGIVPSIFHLLGEAPFRRLALSREVAAFWEDFRRLVGIALFASGLAAYLACSAWLIFFGRGPHVEFDPPKAFVASGPYRWVRNPVVICLFIAAAGEALYLASPGIALFILLGAGFAHYQVTRIEEPRLRRRFGQPYEDYCRTVPRWIPRPPAG
jgi:protein-S-isoprenylcysteine O-methyltransferase Ste14